MKGLNRHSTAPCSSTRGRTDFIFLAVIKMTGMFFPRRLNFPMEIRARHSRHGDVEDQALSLIDAIR